ncbi:CPVL (predicted), partial [Pycnogonum litorale]
DNGNGVYARLGHDILKSVKNWLAVMMNNYKVMLYSGQLDIMVAPILTENFLQKLKWKYSEEYKNASRVIYKVSATDKKVAGYVTKFRDFYQVIIRNAGHFLPFEQPSVAYDMITRFVDGNGFD